MKALIRIIIAVLTVSVLAIPCMGLLSCAPEGDSEILTVYDMYVAYAESNGVEPLTYDEWLYTVKGEKGDTGATGVGVSYPPVSVRTNRRY